MTERGPFRRWIFHVLITLALALPILAVYLYLAQELRERDRVRHMNAVNNQLNQWQEQLYDFKWDAQADTRDDSRHLEHKDDSALLRQTMGGYTYPSGENFLEGMAVLDGGGRVLLKAPALVDEDGEPQDRAILDWVIKARPWLSNPWLPDYNFVSQALVNDPDADFYFSPLVGAEGRDVIVMAHPVRDDSGVLQRIVLIQASLNEIFRFLIAPGMDGRNVWIMDPTGRLGLATSDLARASALAFAEKDIRTAVKKGREKAGEGAAGAGGDAVQQLPQGKTLLSWRTLEGNLCLGVVETTQALSREGTEQLQALLFIAVVSLALLASGGAIFTFKSIQRERQTVELDTLRRYAGTVSHRVRNDLVPLRGVVELASSGLITDVGEMAQRLQTRAVPALEDIESTVRELEELSKGKVHLVYDGQSGRSTMFKTGVDSERGAGKNDFDNGD